MRLTCPHCGHGSDVPAEALPPPGTQARCQVCSAVAWFDGRTLQHDDPTPARPLEAITGDDDATPANPLPAVGAPRSEGLGGGGAAAAAAAAATATATATAVDEWHRLDAGGQPIGPFSLAQVKQAIRTGDLTESDPVWFPGAADWAPAGESAELHRYFAIKAKAAGVAAAAAAAGAGGGAAAGAASAVDPFSRCSRHPAIDAAWSCAGCGNSWCSSCTVLKDLPGGQVHACSQCDRPCKPFERPKVIVPWWTEIPELFKFPVRGLAWMSLPIFSAFWMMGLLSSMAGMYGFAAGIIIDCGILSYLLYVVRQTSEGGRRLPSLGHVEEWKNDLLWPGLKGLLVTILALLPLRMYVNGVAGPAVGEYLMAQGVETMEEGEFAGEGWDDGSAWGEGEEWSEGEGWGAEQEWGEETSRADQEAALREALEQMGADEETIEDSLAEMRADWEEGEAEDDWADMPSWGEADTSGPSGFTVFLKLLGVPVLALYALVLWPILLIIVALFNTIAPAFNPALVLRIVREVKFEYTRLLLFIGALLIPWGILSVLASRNLLVQMMIPNLITFVAVPAYFYVQLVVFYAIGRTAEQIDQKIDWY